MYIFAYIDAGTGSVIIQVVIGFVVGLGVIIRAYWSKIKSFVSKKSVKTSEDLRTANIKKND